MVGLFTRSARQYKFVAAAGSKVEVKQYNVLDQLSPGLGSPGVTFDVEAGTLTDIHINRDTTNSGDVGNKSRTRVGFDWNFALTLSFPADVIGSTLAVAFVQQLLGSARSVWMRFYMGDPEFWSNRIPRLPVRTFTGSRALLSQVVQRFDVNGLDVVGLNVAGEGNSILVPELDGVAV